MADFLLGTSRIDKLFVGEGAAAKAYCGATQVWRPYWTPAEISTEMWLDSADLNSIGLDDNNRVAEWWDKSGNGNDCSQWDENRRPGLDADGMIFTGAAGSGDLLYCSADMTGENAFGIFAAIKADSQAAAQSVFRQQNSSYFVFPWTQAGAVAPKTIMSWDGGSGSTIYNGTLTNYCTAEFTRYENGGTYNITYLDGNVVVSQSMNNYNYFTGGSGSCYVGSFFGDEFYDGRLRELILYFGQIDTDDRKKIEGYLAWKWGTVASLPATHPYKDAAP